MSGAVQRLVVGLGNPDAAYAKTRHNIGWMVADGLAERLQADWEAAGRLHGETARAGTVLLLKPTTYMNASGRSVRAAADFYKVPSERILIISDDINLPFGEVRFRRNGGPGGHNGLTDVIAQLGTTEIARVRVGVGEPPGPDATPHVLSRFTPAEQTQLPEVIAAAVNRAVEWLDG